MGEDHSTFSWSPDSEDDGLVVEHGWHSHAHTQTANIQRQELVPLEAVAMIGGVFTVVVVVAVMVMVDIDQVWLGSMLRGGRMSHPGVLSLTLSIVV